MGPLQGVAYYPLPAPHLEVVGGKLLLLAWGFGCWGSGLAFHCALPAWGCQAWGMDSVIAVERVELTPVLQLLLVFGGLQQGCLVVLADLGMHCNPLLVAVGTVARWGALHLPT